MSLSGGEDRNKSKQREEKSPGARSFDKPVSKSADKPCSKNIETLNIETLNNCQGYEGSNVIHLGVERKKRNLKPSCVDNYGERPASDDNAFAEIIDFPELPAYRASIEIDDFHCLKMLHGTTDIELVLDKVRAILRQQFGDRSVQRHNRFFIIQHQNIELLIAGLLRAQFYCYKIDLPESNVFGEITEQAGLALTWGVGRNVAQAQTERLKKKRQKLQRRRLKQRKKPRQPG